MFIQLAKNVDAEAIFALYQSCRKQLELARIFQWTDLYPAQNNVIEDIKNGHLYIIKNDSDISAVVTLNSSEDSEYTLIPWLGPSNNFLVIHRLAVNPAYQNQGIAGLMMSFAEQLALAAGMNWIRLDCYSKNDKAVTFYENRNYLRRGQILFPGRSHLFYCYEKQLTLV